MLPGSQSLIAVATYAPEILIVDVNVPRGRTVGSIPHTQALLAGRAKSQGVNMAGKPGVASLAGKGARLTGAVPGTVSALRCNRDSNSIVSGGNCWVRTFDAETLQTEETYLGHATHVTAMDVQTNGKWFITGSLDRTVLLWDYRAAGYQCKMQHSAGVTCGELHTGQSEFIFGDEVGRLCAWNLASNKLLVLGSEAGMGGAAGWAGRPNQPPDSDEGESSEGTPPRGSGVTRNAPTGPRGSVGSSFPNPGRDFVLKPESLFGNSAVQAVSTVYDGSTGSVTVVAVDRRARTAVYDLDATSHMTQGSLFHTVSLRGEYNEVVVSGMEEPLSRPASGRSTTPPSLAQSNIPEPLPLMKTPSVLSLLPVPSRQLSSANLAWSGQGISHHLAASEPTETVYSWSFPASQVMDAGHTVGAKGHVLQTRTHWCQWTGNTYLALCGSDGFTYVLVRAAAEPQFSLLARLASHGGTSAATVAALSESRPSLAPNHAWPGSHLTAPATYGSGWVWDAAFLPDTEGHNEGQSLKLVTSGSDGSCYVWTIGLGTPRNRREFALDTHSSLSLHSGTSASASLANVLHCGGFTRIVTNIALL